MSVFERKLLPKIHLDDTEILIPSIINFEVKSGHIQYLIRVKKGYALEQRLYVYRRYKDFLSLHNSFHEAGLDLPLPPKKYIGNMERAFIAERQAALQVYLDEIVKNPLLSASHSFKMFLDPCNYETNKDVLDSSVNELQMIICQESEIKGFKLLPQLGWRFRKKSYLVSFKGSHKKEHLLQWVPFGPDRVLDDEEINGILKALSSLQHVNIAKIEKAGVFKGGGWVLHDIKKRTLLDTLSNVKDPLSSSVLKKYANYSQRKPLDTSQIIEISSQILQALAFVHHKGIPYGHLHPGNVLLDGIIVRLYGVENTILGLPCFYRNLLINLKIIDSVQAIDVFSFGLLLYEMLFAKSFNIVTKEISQDCPAPLRSVLDSILSLRAMKNGLPSVKDLLNLQVFRRPPPNPHPYFKITPRLQELLDSAGTKVINRVKDDYSQVKARKKAKAMEKLLTDNNALPTYLPHPT